MSSLDELLMRYDFLVGLLGFDNRDEFELYKHNATMGFIKYGGGFGKPFGHALAHADAENTFKMIKHWREECDHHADLYLKLKDKQL